MKKLIFTLAVVVSFFVESKAVVVPIATAKTYSTGAAVTVRGIASNGSEFGGSTRFIQDGTAGICLYGSQCSSVNRGDSIEATGTIAPYNNLMEIAVTSVTIINSGNTIHPPVILSIPSAYAEIYEGSLVQINTISFTTPGTFAGNQNYNITDGANTAQVRINASSNLVATPIPSGNIGMVGIMGQYTTTYQLLPRDLNDILISGNPPIFTTTLSQTNITTTSFTVNFQTQNAGNTIINYGLTNALGTIASNATMTTSHSQNLTGLTPGTLYYVKGITISASGDTSFSSIQVMGTESLSSQTITCYFNRSTDSTFASSSANYAHTLNQIAADTLKAYIARAKYTLDVAIYNIDDMNGIITAINQKAAAGLTVRVVCDAGVSSASYNAFIASVQKTMSPTGAAYGIMHNKFVIIDANSTDPNDPIVWTGSMNFTDQQVKTDAQNIIIFQDQTMARGYTIEFNEMLISQKFGPDKSDNTPHEYVLQGHRVEQYFSPSDIVNSHVKDAMLTANTSIHFILFSFTRTELAYPISDNYQSVAGYFAQGIIHDTAQSTAVYNTLVTPMTIANLKLNQFGWLMHHKYSLVDADNPFSDPQVCTGSYNYTNSATTRNDENEVIVHDEEIANQYLQEFAARFEEQGGVVIIGVNDVAATSHFELTAYPNPTSDNLTVNFYSEKNADTKICLIDISGKIVDQHLFANEIGNKSFGINTSSLATGMYLLQVKSGNFSETKKICIAR